MVLLEYVFSIQPRSGIEPGCQQIFDCQS